MSDCQANHKHCAQVAQQSHGQWHPTRLINVSPEFSDKTIKLEDDPKKLAGAQYCTLSYCWGRNPNFVKLQTSNYSNFKNGIRYSRLPRTLQDAITFTRALKIQYIWIDALCIIQDSTRGLDWLKESLMMSEVYGQSYVNLAASSSTDAEGGLFRERDPLTINVTHIKPEISKSESYTIMHNTDWFQDLLSEPLNSRAWAIQERRLSSRTIHFTDSQILWECNELGASEIFPAGQPGNRVWSSSQNRFSVARSKNSTTAIAWHREWWGLVTEYSRSELSVETDRLVAIAGLARCFRQISNNDTYCAGHFRKQMPHNLLWHVAWPHNQQVQPYIAPTWSWASIPMGIEIRGPPTDLTRNGISTANVIEVHVETGGNDYGLVTGGFIRLCAPMCVATFLDDSHLLSFSPIRSKVSLQENCWKPKGHGLRAPSWWRSNKKDDSKHPPPLKLWWDMKPEGEVVFCMKLEADFMVNHCGLLLQPTGISKGEFRRIGIYELDGAWNTVGNNKSKVDAYCWAMNKAFLRCDISEEQYEEFDENGFYTIRVV
jgi:hypothetical protein